MQNKTNVWQSLFLILLLFFLFPRTLSDSCWPADLLSDHGGRLVNLPANIGKIYATTEAGLFLTYAIEPDSITGWNRGLSPELEFAIHPRYYDLPTVGTWDQTFQTICLDTVLDLEPDLVLHYAPIDADNIALADEIQATLGIPTILLDNSMRALPDALRILGALLDKQLRGRALATFVENQLTQTAHFQVLQESFQPIPVHIVSDHNQGHFDELLELAGMIELPNWNDQPPLPDFVLIMPHSITDPYDEVERDGHKRIYQIPSFPLNWLEPGSLFSLLGLQWLHSLAYPTTYNTDLAQIYTVFMEVFFEVTVTDELLDWTLKRSGISF